MTMQRQCDNNPTTTRQQPDNNAISVQAFAKPESAASVRTSRSHPGMPSAALSASM
jgi:hypothetical protein